MMKMFSDQAADAQAWRFDGSLSTALRMGAVAGEEGEFVFVMPVRRLSVHPAQGLGMSF
jgi:hypothetical protein